MCISENDRVRQHFTAHAKVKSHLESPWEVGFHPTTHFLMTFDLSWIFVSLFGLAFLMGEQFWNVL